MSRVFIILLFVIGLSACATTANYEKILNSWVGANVNQLVSSWGYPENSFTAPNGNTVYAYNSSGSYTTPTNTTTTYSGYGNSVYANTSTTGGQTYNYTCQTFIEFNQKNIITTWSWKGNNCKAP